MKAIAQVSSFRTGGPAGNPLGETRLYGGTREKLQASVRDADPRYSIERIKNF